MNSRYMVLALLLVHACAAKPRGRDVEGPPRWMTDGDQVRLELIESFLQRSDSVRAMQIIQVLRSEGREIPELDLFQAIALRQQGMLDEAATLLTIAGKKLTKDPRVPREACILHADRGALDDAIAACRTATQLDGSNAAAWNNLGFLQMTTRVEPKVVVTSFERAVHLDGTEPRYRNNLGYAHVLAGNSRAALSAFSTVNTPQDAYYNLGVALERAERLEEARKAYEKALSFDSSHLLAGEAAARLASPETP